MTTLDDSLDYLKDISTPIINNVAPKSRTMAANTHANRNRFYRFLLLNLLIWPLFALVGFHFAQSHSPSVSQSLLKTSGSQAMSADELSALTNGQKRPIFWLGRLSGDTYLENSTVSGVDVVTYLPENATPKTHGHLDLVIMTYRNSNVFNDQLHPLSETADTTVEKVGGVSVTYNPASPDHSVVVFKNRPQVVALTYPEFQTISTLVMDAQNLASIQ